MLARSFRNTNTAHPKDMPTPQAHAEQNEWSTP
jgi:hypothetical protein